MTEQEYRKLDAISQSDIKEFIKNRKGYEALRILGTGTGLKTASTDLGSINHTVLFENDEFHNRYAIFKGSVPNSPEARKFVNLMREHRQVTMSLEDVFCNCYSTKSLKPAEIPVKAMAKLNEFNEYLCFLDSDGHKELITEEYEALSRMMIENVYKHPGVQKTLLVHRAKHVDSAGSWLMFKELAIVWKHHITSRLLKSKIDELHVDMTNRIAYAYDYKTTKNTNASSFIGSAKYYGYDIQESFYVEAIKFFLKEQFGEDFQVIFRFIPQLNSFPYNVLGVIEFSPNDREIAYIKWTEALAGLDRCLDNGEFDNPEAYIGDGVTRMELNNSNNIVLVEDGF